MYKALNLSKYIVNKCVADNHPISNLQLQKILYYIQEDFVRRGELAFSDDIEAWQFGPVVPNVYYYYCGNGSMPIQSEFVSYDIALADKERIDGIVRRKRRLKPWDLVADTHKVGSPWYRVFDSGKGNRCVIPIDLMKRRDNDGH